MKRSGGGATTPNLFCGWPATLFSISSFLFFSFVSLKKKIGVLFWKMQPIPLGIGIPLFLDE